MSRSAHVPTNALSDEYKKILHSYGASIVNTPLQTVKAIGIPRSADIVHSPTVSKLIAFGKMVSTTIHLPAFVRAVTIRRTLTSSISHLKKMYMKLEGRLIPTGATIIEKFKQIYLEWE
jgi:hypothetical protein